MLYKNPFHTGMMSNLKKIDNLYAASKNFPGLPTSLEDGTAGSVYDPRTFGKYSK